MESATHISPRCIQSLATIRERDSKEIRFFFVKKLKGADLLEPKVLTHADCIQNQFSKPKRPNLFKPLNLISNPKKNQHLPSSFSIKGKMDTSVPEAIRI